jgi:Rad3-related DNA helicase
MSYVVPVRALCEFAAKRGDLDLRFTPSPTAQQGIAGHAAVAARRGAAYRTELRLEGRYRSLTVRGRADGYANARGVLVEIKTHRGPQPPENHRALHWAQLKVYAALLCREEALAALDLALVYYDIGTQQETVLRERHDAASLWAFFVELCERFLGWAEQELAHRAARDASLRRLAFPHEAFRAGQRQLAEAVWRAAKGGRVLMAQAPTGIGKTIATLFPLLKACGGGVGNAAAPDIGNEGGARGPAAAATGASGEAQGQDSTGLDKIFFLTAKGSGRPLALQALARLQDVRLQESQDSRPCLRVLELVAREQACVHPDKACHGESCPLARGFYDRLPAARSAAVRAGPLDRATLRELALQHAVCPYHLGHELVRWADVVVGDYNHYFDLAALLHGLTVSHEWRVGVLVDEAHNLLERGRTMYSARLEPAALQPLMQTLPPAPVAALRRLQRAWQALGEGRTAPCSSVAEVPKAFAVALQRALDALSEYLADTPQDAGGELLAFYFEALQFARLLEVFGEHSLFEVNLGSAGAALALRNLVPAPFLKPRFAAAYTATLFSATLTPTTFYRDTLGLPADSVSVDVESPFSAEQLAIRVAGHISTRWQHRARSIAPIVEVMAQQVAQHRGNYLAFFSSFEYLQQVHDAFRLCHPQLAAWRQHPGMDAAERAAFLARFEEGGCGIGFAVLGGVFGEGIDLPGRRLIGAFVATLGLPPLNADNERMRERMQQAFGAGYDYTYLYPGLQKVVQAAGRVIRGPADRGVIVLIDDRYRRPEVRRLLPAWWPAATSAL